MITNLEMQLAVSCGIKDLAEVKRVFQKLEYRLSSKAFYYVCLTRNIEGADFLLKNSVIPVDIHVHMLSIFLDACKAGDLRFCQWLISLESKHGLINIHQGGYILENCWDSLDCVVSTDGAFVAACDRGHIDLGRWLMSLEPTHGEIGKPALSFLAKLDPIGLIDVLESVSINYKRKRSILDLLREFEHYEDSRVLRIEKFKKHLIAHAKMLLGEASPP